MKFYCIIKNKKDDIFEESFNFDYENLNDYYSFQFKLRKSMDNYDSYRWHLEEIEISK